MPKVSVLVPLYNTDHQQLREMIDSVLAQTFKDFELILLNDSPENQSLRQIVESYTDPRIRYEENPKNIGISPSRNRLIDLACGEYLAIHDHDDISFPYRFAKQVEYLDANPWVGVVSGGQVTIPSSGKDQTYPEDNLEIKRAMMVGCALLHPAAMIRKSVLTDNHIRYEAAYTPAEDYMLWVRLMGVTMFHNLKDPLIQYRNSVSNTSHQRVEQMKDADLRIKSAVQNLYPTFGIKNSHKKWVTLFEILPLLKIKENKKGIKIQLFGLIPIVSIKNKYL